MEVPSRWGLDLLYFRDPDEQPYARNLSALDVPPDGVPTKLDFRMLSFPSTIVPFRWSIPQTPCAADFRSFPPRGDLLDPDGGDIALDSAWALREGALADDCGDPGRMLAEIRREGRDLTRKYAEFIPYQAVEYYQQSPPARHELYPAIPAWWDEVWVSQRMFVPLPPVLSYRASAFLPNKVGTPEGQFFQLVLEAEWSALVFSRWCSDIPQRGIMWWLSPRLRRNVDELGLENLLHGSTYKLSDVKDWLREHDNHRWSEKQMPYEERGAHSAEPARARTLFEFVRIFPRYRVSTLSGSLPRPDPWGDAIDHAPPHRVVMTGTEGEYDPYAPPRPEPRRGPALHADNPSGSITAVASDDMRGRGERNIPESLYVCFREAGLEELIQHHARRQLHRESERELVPVSEYSLVACVHVLDRAHRDLHAQVGEMQVALDSLRERLADSEERARRAERQSDLLAEAYSLFGRDSAARKRSRGE
jgi:hypothetical protein